MNTNIIQDIFIFLPKYPNINNEEDIDFLNPYDENFYQAIFEKKEFYDERLDEKVEKTEEGTLLKHQKIISRFLSSHTPYDQILLMHQMGTGKSQAAIGSIELILKNENSSFTGAIIVAKNQTLLGNFKGEIKKLTGNEYIPPGVSELTEGEEKARTKKLMSKHYSFSTFYEIAKNVKTLRIANGDNNDDDENERDYFEPYSNQNIIDEYSNKIIVIDEVHNIRSKEDDEKNKEKINKYKEFYYLLHNVKNCKIILLSGTPMKDNIGEFPDVLNLILPRDQNFETGDDFVKEYFKNDKIIPSKADEFKEKIKGRVSYLKSSVSEVKKEFVGKKNVGKLKHFIVDEHNMSKFQSGAYIEANNKKSGFELQLRQASSFVFPDKTFGSEAFPKQKEGKNSEWIKLVKKTQTVKKRKGDDKKYYVLTDKFKEKLQGKTDEETLKNIKKYSVAFYYCIKDILESVKKDKNGNCMIDSNGKSSFVYTEFVFGSGGILFSLLLGLFGFSRAYGDEKTKGCRYVLFNNEIVDDNERLKLLNRFNNPDNLHGEYINIIIGSKSVSEGVTFKNIQKEYIITPHWNYSETDQAIARGFRFGSHQALLDSGVIPKVEVYQYVSIPVNGEGKPLYKDSIDLRMYTIAEGKDIAIKQIDRLVKEASIDCALTYKRNYTPGYDYQRECDYMDCSYSCDGVPSKLYKTSDEEEVKVDTETKIDDIETDTETNDDAEPKDIKEIIIEGLRRMGTYSEIVRKYNSAGNVRKALKEKLVAEGLIGEDVDLKEYKELIKNELDTMAEEESDDETTDEEEESSEEEEKKTDIEDPKNKEITLDIKKVSFFFKNKNVSGKPVNLSKLKFTEESVYSITPWREADIISKKIIELIGETAIITDATSNVGGNTIGFYNNGFKIVNSVEIDANTCRILKNNLEVYGYPTDRVYCEDYLKVHSKLKQDVVFFDPPWGGPDYYKKAVLDLYLDNNNIIDIIAELLNKNQTELVILKAPTNFNYDRLKANLGLYNIEKNPMSRGIMNKISYYVFYITKKEDISSSGETFDSENFNFKTEDQLLQEQYEKDLNKIQKDENTKDFKVGNYVMLVDGKIFEHYGKTIQYGVVTQIKNNRIFARFLDGQVFAFSQEDIVKISKEQYENKKGIYEKEHPDGGYDGADDLELDLSTYELYYNKDVVNKIMNDVINLYKHYFKMDLNSIINHFPDYTLFEVITALRNIINLNVIIYNKYGFPTYLKESNNIYFLVDNLTVENNYYSEYYTQNPIVEVKIPFSKIVENIFLSKAPFIIKKLFKLKNIEKMKAIIYKQLPLDIQETILENSITANIKGITTNQVQRDLILEIFKDNYKRINTEDGEVYISLLLRKSKKIYKCLEVIDGNIDKEGWKICKPEFVDAYEEDIQKAKEEIEEFYGGYHGLFNVEPDGTEHFCIKFPDEKKEEDETGKKKNFSKIKTGQKCITLKKDVLQNLIINIFKVPIPDEPLIKSKQELDIRKEIKKSSIKDLKTKILEITSKKVITAMKKETTDKIKGDSENKKQLEKDVKKYIKAEKQKYDEYDDEDIKRVYYWLKQKVKEACAMLKQWLKQENLLFNDPNCGTQEKTKKKEEPKEKKGKKAKKGQEESDDEQ